MLEVVARARFDELEAQPRRAGSRFEGRAIHGIRRIGRIDQRRDAREVRHDGGGELEGPRNLVERVVHRAGHVGRGAGRLAAQCERLFGGDHDDRDRLRCLHEGRRREGRAGDDDVSPFLDQLRRKPVEEVALAIAIAHLIADIAALHVSDLSHGREEYVHARLQVAGRAEAEHADARQRRGFLSSGREVRREACALALFGMAATACAATAEVPPNYGTLPATYSLYYDKDRWSDSYSVFHPGEIPLAGEASTVEKRCSAK